MRCVMCALGLQVFARASKYSLFDPAKEMVYIEMDADEKKQGKAAVDLVGSQVRRSIHSPWLCCVPQTVALIHCIFQYSGRRTYAVQRLCGG